MVTKNMYRFLKRIPLWPKNKTQKQLGRMVVLSKFQKLHLTMSGIEKGYIGSNGNGDSAGFYLTERGKEVIEEYRRTQKTSALSIIALIISILGLLPSVIAITTK